MQREAAELLGEEQLHTEHTRLKSEIWAEGAWVSLAPYAVISAVWRLAPNSVLTTSALAGPGRTITCGGPVSAVAVAARCLSGDHDIRAVSNVSFAQYTMSGAPTPSSTLPFGTASAYADSFPAPAPKELTLGAETCFNLSVFKGAFSWAFDGG